MAKFNFYTDFDWIDYLTDYYFICIDYYFYVNFQKGRV